MATRGTKPDAAAWAAALKHRPSYSKPLGDYFATYEVRERGLKKWIEEARHDWIARGCKGGGPEFPPLDDPSKMLDWWLAHKKHAPSAKLYSLAGQDPAASTQSASAATAKPTAPGSSTSGASEPDNTPKRAAVDLNTLTGVDLAGAALQQRRILAAALQEHAEALARADTPEATINLRAKRVHDAMESLRAVEASLIKQQREAGDLVHLDAVRAELAPLLNHIAISLIDLLTDRLGQSRARARDLADELFRSLCASRFAPPLAP